jgi:DNA-binding NarL/FixJ family response regulator
VAEGRVLIVEDEVIVAEALRRSLEASGYEVIGHAIDAREAIEMACQLRPDVVLMDIVLDGLTCGIEAALSIQRTIDTSIIYVTGQSDETVVRAAALSGAFGYIVKPFQAQQVTSSIAIALRRRHDARAMSEPTTINESGVTGREREVIRSFIRHRRVSRVAETLGISVHTARNHLKSVFRKLNLHSQDELLDLFLDDEGRSRFH